MLRVTNSTEVCHKSESEAHTEGLRGRSFSGGSNLSTSRTKPVLKSAELSKPLIPIGGSGALFRERSSLTVVPDCAGLKLLLPTLQPLLVHRAGAKTVPRSETKKHLRLESATHHTGYDHQQPTVEIGRSKPHTCAIAVEDTFHWLDHVDGWPISDRQWVPQGSA